MVAHALSDKSCVLTRLEYSCTNLCVLKVSGSISFFSSSLLTMAVFSLCSIAYFKFSPEPFTVDQLFDYVREYSWSLLGMNAVFHTILRRVAAVYDVAVWQVRLEYELGAPHPWKRESTAWSAFLSRLCQDSCGIRVAGKVTRAESW